MTAELVALARDLHASGFGQWKEIAALLGVNVHTLIYHTVVKQNPSSITARHRAWARWAPNRRTP